MRGIFIANQKALLECVESLETNIIMWKNMIKDDNKKMLRAKIEEVSGERRKL